VSGSGFVEALDGEMAPLRHPNTITFTDSGEVQFHELRQPAPADLEEIAFNVHQRFLRWLCRHGLLKNEVDNEFSNEAP